MKNICVDENQPFINLPALALRLNFLQVKEYAAAEPEKVKRQKTVEH